MPFPVQRKVVRKRIPIAHAFPYLDTICIWMPYLPPGILAEIFEAQGAPPIRKEVPSSTRPGTFCVIVHQPRAETLRVMEYFRQIASGSVCRIDVAYDIVPVNLTLSELTEWLLLHVMLRWRTGRMVDVYETTYWVQQAGRKRRSERDLVLYADLKSKLLGEAINHLELRLYTSRACRTSGVSRATDLLSLDPRYLFDRHIRLADFDRNRARQQFVRKVPLKYRRSAALQWDRVKLDRAQAFHDHFRSLRGQLVTQSSTLIKIPTSLGFVIGVCMR